METKQVTGIVLPLSIPSFVVLYVHSHMVSEGNFPGVSIVLATYNGEKYLHEQLNSLLQQDYPVFDIIVSDDASTDSTREILKSYAEKFPNIRLHFNEHNAGYIKNFEKAIGYTTGSFIALSDQDDIWKPDKLSVLMKHVGKADIVYCDSELINEQGLSLERKISDIKNLGNYSDCLPFLIGNCASGHAMLMRREFAISAIPFPNAFVHDWWLAFCASCSNGLHFVDQPLVQYRQHAANILGAVKPESGSRKRVKENEIQKIKDRIAAFYDRAQEVKNPHTALIGSIKKSYESFSLEHNFQRMGLFLKYRDEITAIKKRSSFRKTLFCLKMFFKVI